MRAWFWLAAAAIPVAFAAFNYRAYDGFFQDDELDTLAWTPFLSMRNFAVAVMKPTFDVDNFRPPGHLYFALMGHAFGMNFPPYITPVFALHLLNVLLLFLLMRKLAIAPWCALAGAAFFALSATAMDAYWKPMYVFDLLCTTFSLASILLWSGGRWFLSLISFWLAYKSKELAVMLPPVLLAYEYWWGKRRFARLIPFFLISLSFGLQGIILNPNTDNEYTFRFTLAALKKTLPFYAQRVFFVRFGGLALLLLAFIRDRRVWFGLLAMACFVFALLFLPGRLFEAYAYLPLAGAVIALSAAASYVNPLWIGIALLVWLPGDLRHLRREQRVKLTNDDEAYAFFDALQNWAVKNPDVRTLVYTDGPVAWKNWGVTGAWNIMHRNRLGLKALYWKSQDGRTALHEENVAFAIWDARKQTLQISVHSPDQPSPL